MKISSREQSVRQERRDEKLSSRQSLFYRLPLPNMRSSQTTVLLYIDSYLATTFLRIAYYVCTYVGGLLTKDYLKFGGSASDPMWYYFIMHEMLLLLSTVLLVPPYPCLA
jgi:hypothetical protein